MTAVTLFLALVLAFSAAHKLTERQRLSLSAARLVGVSAEQGVLLLAVAGALEAIAALALLMPPLHGVGVGLAALVWLTYGVALFRHRGQSLDCGCDLVAKEKPVGAFAIGRAFGLAALAGLTLALPAGGWTLDAPFAALAMLALYFAGSELAVLPQGSKGVLR